MSKPKGGRGIKAPYETTHVRVPIPIKDKVDKLIEDYRDSLLDNDDRFTASEGINTSSEKNLVNLQEAITIAQCIISQRKSARISISRLLKALYDVEINPKDL